MVYYVFRIRESEGDVKCYTTHITIIYGYFITPSLYNYKEILFIHTGLVGGIIAHYHVLKEKPNKKFVELNKMTADFWFVDAVGASLQCIYIPIVRLISSTLRFPIDTSSTI
jgi:hypothetical protein